MVKPNLYHSGQKHNPHSKEHYHSYTATATATGPDPRCPGKSVSVTKEKTARSEKKAKQIAERMAREAFEAAYGKSAAGKIRITIKVREQS
ncbi:hypothetical protein [Reticulibacter mediterranei]|nr:hypothetical protein [Reticulibacter mediterranei]